MEFTVGDRPCTASERQLLREAANDTILDPGFYFKFPLTPRKRIPGTGGMETGEQPYNVLSSAGTGEHVRGDGTARENQRPSTYREPAGRRTARQDWFAALQQADQSRQQVFGQLGAALGQAAVLRAQGRSPYMDEMMARRQAAMLMGMPSGI